MRILAKEICFTPKFSMIIALLLSLPAAAQEIVPINRDDFLSQHYNETTLRTGNSHRHKVIAKFYRKGIPFKVLQEVNSEKVDLRERWVRVRDFEGQKGWIRRDQLHNRPTVLVMTNDEMVLPLYASLNHASHRLTPLAVLPNLHVLHLLGCSRAWCQVEAKTEAFGKLEGYVERAFLWGDSNH